MNRNSKPYSMNVGAGGAYYVQGPDVAGEGGFYTHVTFTDKQSAESAAKMCNVAFRIGYEEAMLNLRQLLGVEK